MEGPGRRMCSPDLMRDIHRRLDDFAQSIGFAKRPSESCPPDCPRAGSQDVEDTLRFLEKRE